MGVFFHGTVLVENLVVEQSGFLHWRCFEVVEVVGTGQAWVCDSPAPPPAPTPQCRAEGIMNDGFATRCALKLENLI